MKSLAKLILPLAFSAAFSLNSIDSKAQDFLPGKFKNYRQKKKDTVLISFYNYHDKPFIAFVYDLDKDSLWDVIEFFPIKVIRQDTVKTLYPKIYLLKLNKNEEPKIIIDREIDGLNQNEHIINPADSSYLKIKI